MLLKVIYYYSLSRNVLIMPRWLKSRNFSHLLIKLVFINLITSAFWLQYLINLNYVIIIMDLSGYVHNFTCMVIGSLGKIFAIFFIYDDHLNELKQKKCPFSIATLAETPHRTEWQTGRYDAWRNSCASDDIWQVWTYHIRLQLHTFRGASKPYEGL